jgi:hypothetical protein
MNLKSTIEIYSAAAGGQAGGSSLINYPGSPADDANLPTVRDKARKRLVRPFASPDVDAGSTRTNETKQTDSAGFVGKKYVIQDTPTYGYGHYISEHDSSSSAALAEQARPGSRILKHPELHNLQSIRKKAQRKAATVNPDVEE